MAPRPEPLRGVRVRDAGGYVERISVLPGGTVRFHVAAPAAYELEVVRLGRRAIASAAASAAADRADSEHLASFSRPTAARGLISPGSYVYVSGGSAAGRPDELRAMAAPVAPARTR